MKVSQLRQLIREEVDRVLNEDDRAFPRAVFNQINDAFEANKISEKLYRVMAMYLMANEKTITRLYSSKGEEGAKQAFDYIYYTITK